jgi:hypothetical protein
MALVPTSRADETSSTQRDRADAVKQPDAALARIRVKDRHRYCQARRGRPMCQMSQGKAIGPPPPEGRRADLGLRLGQAVDLVGGFGERGGDLSRRIGRHALVAVDAAHRQTPLNAAIGSLRTVDEDFGVTDAASGAHPRARRRWRVGVVPLVGPGGAGGHGDIGEGLGDRGQGVS